MKSKALSALAVLVALTFAACGSDEETSAGSGGGNSTDRAFAADMIPHHESAIEMAEIAQERGESEFVKTLAANIIESQSEEIKTLKSEDSSLADDEASGAGAAGAAGAGVGAGAAGASA